ncbi:MAG: N-acetylmuramoyl-L-alanine amidase [Kangiellaceae bacterium]|nr:N-acetylmuramoyl-L-alanine amidase [Kangiellaceae bacterium]MCW8999267.1 N-acetylmuramoyl-L-alanine amidase [Kangiellaceae bacterium]MCW9017035.1 N-acetylmuramoyl-L-alanine amidase [Kangiellaceae bacterium]
MNASVGIFFEDSGRNYQSGKKRTSLILEKCHLASTTQKGHATIKGQMKDPNSALTKSSDANNKVSETQSNQNRFTRRRFLISATSAVALGIAGGMYWSGRWEYIVIHHSAGNFGNIEFLQKVHRQRQAGDPIDAIPYHFVIGNGNGMGLGEIASDWRKENNIWGAHVSGRNSERNFLGLGICMIGNFEKTPVKEQQYQALVRLCRKLMKQYNIPVENISGHGLTEGEMTLCPGKYFPMQRLISEIS